MMRRRAKTSAVLFLAFAAGCLHAADTAAAGIEMGRQFLYCGELSVRAARLQGVVESEPYKYVRQARRVQAVSMAAASAYLTDAQMAVEYFSASEKVEQDAQLALDQDAAQTGAAQQFVRQKMADCAAFEAKNGSTAIAKFMAQAAKPAAQTAK